MAHKAVIIATNGTLKNKKYAINNGIMKHIALNLAYCFKIKADTNPQHIAKISYIRE